MDKEERERQKREFREWFQPRFVRQVELMQQGCSLKGVPIDRPRAMEMVSKRLLSRYEVVLSDGTRIPDDIIELQKETVREMVADLTRESLC